METTLAADCSACNTCDCNRDARALRKIIEDNWDTLPMKVKLEMYGKFGLSMGITILRKF